MKIIEFFERKLSWFVSPLTGMSFQLDITNRCNLKCMHCYQDPERSQIELELSQWVSVIDQCISLGAKLGQVTSFTICGGEPLLSKNFLPIINYLKIKNPKGSIKVVTNGTVMTESILNTLKDADAQIFVSFDGATSFTHDQIRGFGAFEKTKVNVIKMVNSGLKVCMQMVLSSRTVHEIDQFYIFAKTIGVKSVSFNRLILSGKAIESMENFFHRPLSPFELKNAYSLIYFYSLSEKEIISSVEKPLFALIDRNIKGHGKWGYSGFVITYNGLVTASSRIDLVIGSIFTSSIDEIYFESSVLKTIRESEAEKCKVCSLKTVCGGDRNAAYAETGDINGNDPGCWAEIA